jgi:NADPH:quinone reductase
MRRSGHGVNDPPWRQIVLENRQEISRASMMSSAPKNPDGPPLTMEAHCVRLLAKAADVASLAPVVERRTLSRAANEVLIDVKAAAVNPSDVKAATGLMPYAVFPRTPGRDYAGIVIDGPAGSIGREVFGSSGDLGIRRDGTHATHLAVEADAMVEKPKNLSWEEAAGIGVPFVTAMEGFRRAGMPKQDETVLVMGVNGKVGQAAAQIASWHGARVIGVVRKNEPYEGHANGKVDVIVSSTTDVATRVRELTNGKGADIVFNTVGDPYFQAATKSLAVRGRQILIAAINRVVQFDILEFYRGQHAYVGIDTLGLSSIATGAVLRELVPGFASGHLKPFPIRPAAIYSLENAKAAFVAVAGSSRDRVILRPA